jgi:hypothetical protein
MSTRRLLATTAAMGLAAVLLYAVTPDLAWVTDSGTDLQRAVDTVGAETVLLGGVAGLAWATWAWGLLGLLLTALSALPGAAGSLARSATRLLLPAGARRAAALALGVGLAVGAPVLTGCAAPAPAAVELAGSPGPAVAVPDWPLPDDPAAAQPVEPATAPPPVDDWPRPAAGDHVVLRGDCLWDIAAADLRARTGHDPADGAIAAAVRAWWSVNEPVIGPDPDLLLPGQVLHPPP